MAEHRHSAHAVYDLKYDVVWCMKYRYKIMRGRIAERARDLIRQTCESRDVDEQGNVAALMHSCNCFEWGATGIFVDGVSVPDPASFQQGAISRAGPGQRLPETTNPLIVLKDKRPVLASSAIGSALQEVTLQNLINIVDLGMDPQTAVNRPDFEGPFVGISANGWSGAELAKEVLDLGFPAPVIKGLKKRGQEVYEGPSGLGQSGYWIGIRIDPKSGALSGGASQRLNSLVEGY